MNADRQQQPHLAHQALSHLLNGYADLTFAALMQSVQEVSIDPSQFEAMLRALLALLVGDPEEAAVYLSRIVQFEIADHQLDLPHAQRVPPWFRCGEFYHGFYWPRIGASARETDDSIEG